MNAPVVFYAWQNDRPRQTTRDFIHGAAEEAIRRLGSTMRVEESPRLDHDTKNEAGSPPIAETILRKIKRSAILLADLTYCSEIREEAEGKIQKKNPNPNVMLELGYGAAVIGWSRVVLVMNAHYGSPNWLPFDLKNHRFPITYKLGPNSDKGPESRKSLVTDMVQQIGGCLAAEYDLVDSTLARLSSQSRRIMKKHGPSGIFYEKNDNLTEKDRGNWLATAMDLAIAQMLELNVICAIDVANEVGVGYRFTYLGKRCCYKLGVVDRSVPVPTDVIPPMQVIVNSDDSQSDNK